MPMTISICCLTECKPFTDRFLLDMKSIAKELNAEFVLGADGCEELARKYTDKVIPVKSKGYLESVLQEVLDFCTGDYVFRLDDDERVSNSLLEWFHTTELSSPTYSFRRFELYGDENHYLTHHLVHPSMSPRLTTKELAICKDMIHGHFVEYGTVVEQPILHYKFLVKTYKERLEVANKYESIAENAGLGLYKVWTLPEDVDEVLDTIKEIEPGV